MKRFLSFGILLIGFLSVHAQTVDTTKTIRTPNGRVISQPVMKSDKMNSNNGAQLIIFGDYLISGYSVLSLKSPSTSQLDAMIGSIVHINSTYISGDKIDSLSFSIFEIERLKKDDYFFRVFGRETKVVEEKLADTFNVHKTDHKNCYGIAELGDGRLAIPYKGVLIYLTRK